MVSGEASGICSTGQNNCLHPTVQAQIENVAALLARAKSTRRQDCKLAEVKVALEMPTKVLGIRKANEEGIHQAIQSLVGFLQCW